MREVRDGGGGAGGSLGGLGSPTPSPLLSGVG
jgi:hypothetical protein